MQLNFKNFFRQYFHKSILQNYLNAIKHIPLLILTLVLFIFLTQSCHRKKRQREQENLKTISLIIFREHISPNQKKILIKKLPKSLQKKVIKILKQNGFNPAVVSIDSYRKSFRENLSSDKRIKLLKNSSNSIGESSSSSFILMEFKATYYNYISNQFKWNISAKLSFYNQNNKTIQKQNITGSAFLNYKHQSYIEALEQENPDLLYTINNFVSNIIKPALQKTKHKLSIRRSSKKNQSEKDILNNDNLADGLLNNTLTTKDTPKKNKTEKIKLKIRKKIRKKKN